MPWSCSFSLSRPKRVLHSLCKHESCKLSVLTFESSECFFVHGQISEWQEQTTKPRSTIYNWASKWIQRRGQQRPLNTTLIVYTGCHTQRDPIKEALERNRKIIKWMDIANTKIKGHWMDITKRHIIRTTRGHNIDCTLSKVMKDTMTRHRGERGTHLLDNTQEEGQHIEGLDWLEMDSMQALNWTYWTR